MPDITPSGSLPLSGTVSESVSDPWRERAICPGEDPEIFFPVFGDPAIEARLLCTNCPVRLECLQYAMEADEHGIWGGLDREQRRALGLSNSDQDETAVRSEERELA